MAKRELDGLLGASFLEGLERRKFELEKMQWKLFAVQAPLFLFLAFSLLKVDAHISVLGISIEASKNIREVLLLLSSAFALGALGVNKSLSDIKELMKAIIEKLSAKHSDLKEFLEARYGLSFLLSLNPFDRDLRAGKFQWILSALLLLTTIGFFGV